MRGCSIGSAASRASASTTTCARSSPSASATRSAGIPGSSICAAITRSTRPRVRRRRPREKGSVEGAVRYLKTGFWPARRIDSLADLDEQYADWRDRVCNRRRHATGRFRVDERLAEERTALRPLPPGRFDHAYARESRVPLDGYLRYRGCFYRAPEQVVHQRVALSAGRDRVWISHRGEEVARSPRSYEPGSWHPAPRLRPEPPTPPPAAELVTGDLAPPELADY